jgi:DNA mismatch endonuclease (patch repair protein)
MMSGIRGWDTQPELRLRRALHALGFRYRINDRLLPGKPDIVLPRHGAVIFVHGCFWHRHDRCRYATTPATRVEFWRSKFNANVERDARNLRDLRDAGWRVATVWECALAPKNIDRTVERVSRWIDGRTRTLVLGDPIQHS